MADAGSSTSTRISRSRWNGRWRRSPCFLADLGVTVHRVEALAPPASTYLTPEAEGAQLFPRDGIVVIGNRVIELNMRMIWRRREVLGFSFSALLDRLYAERDFLWIAAPKSNP